MKASTTRAYTGVSKRAMRQLRETYWKQERWYRTPFDAGRPRLLEPSAISLYVDHNEPMAAPQVSEIKEFQLRLCYIFFVRPIDMSLAVSIFDLYHT